MVDFEIYEFNSLSGKTFSPEVKKKINYVFSRILSIYPDRKVQHLNRDYKKFSECTVVATRRLAGYGEDNVAFFKDFGFEYITQKSLKDQKDSIENKVKDYINFNKDLKDLINNLNFKSILLNKNLNYEIESLVKEEDLLIYSINKKEVTNYIYSNIKSIIDDNFNVNKIYVNKNLKYMFLASPKKEHIDFIYDDEVLIIDEIRSENKIPKKIQKDEITNILDVIKKKDTSQNVMNIKKDDEEDITSNLINKFNKYSYEDETNLINDFKEENIDSVKKEEIIDDSEITIDEEAIIRWREFSLLLSTMKGTLQSISFTPVDFNEEDDEDEDNLRQENVDELKAEIQRFLNIIDKLEVMGEENPESITEELVGEISDAFTKFIGKLTDSLTHEEDETEKNNFEEIERDINYEEKIVEESIEENDDKKNDEGTLADLSNIYNDLINKENIEAKSSEELVDDKSSNSEDNLNSLEEQETVIEVKENKEEIDKLNKTVLKILQVVPINEYLFDRKLYLKIEYPERMIEEYRKNVIGLCLMDYGIKVIEIYDKTSDYIVFECKLREAQAIDFNEYFKRDLILNVSNFGQYRIEAKDITVVGANKNLSYYNKKPFDITEFNLRKKVKIEILNIDYSPVYNTYVYYKINYPKDLLLENRFNVKKVSIYPLNFYGNEVYDQTENYIILIAKFNNFVRNNLIEYFKVNIFLSGKSFNTTYDADDVTVDIKLGAIPDKKSFTVDKPKKIKGPEISEEYKRYLKEEKEKQRAEKQKEKEEKTDNSKDIVENEVKLEKNIITPECKVKFLGLKHVGGYGLNIFTSFMLPCLDEKKIVNFEWIKVEATIKHNDKKYDIKPLFKEKVVENKNSINLILYLKGYDKPNKITIKNISYKIKGVNEIYELKQKEIFLENDIKNTDNNYSPELMTENSNLKENNQNNPINFKLIIVFSIILVSVMIIIILLLNPSIIEMS